MPRDTAAKRFVVKRERGSGLFRVYDTGLDKNVDGPFRRREIAEARAAKREISAMPIREEKPADVGETPAPEPEGQTEGEGQGGGEPPTGDPDPAPEGDQQPQE